MVNHARSLLINLNPSGNTSLGRLGDEFIDPSYRVTTDPRLNTIRATLFGSDADTWTLNYRAAQYMAILHSNVKALPFVLDLDERTTYRSGRNVYDTDFGCFVTGNASSWDPPYKVNFTSNWLGDDVAGHNFYEYQVRISTTVADDCYVERLNPYLKIVIPQVTDQSIDLPGTDTAFKIKNYQSAAATDITWRLRLIAKPRRSLVQVASEIQGQRQVLEELWSTPGLSSVVTTFRTFFLNSTNITDTLSGCLLSLIYCQEHLRGRE